MLLASSFGVSLTLSVMGVCYYLVPPIANTTNTTNETMVNESALEEGRISEGSVEYPGWLPLLNLMAYIFFFNIGYGSMVWITVAEILPAHTRSITNR